MINCLVIGLGIGQLYCSVNKQLGHAVYTVDTTKPADFTSVEEAVNSGMIFDIVHICTPNASHESIARTVAAANARLVLIEKPGLEHADKWQQLVEDFPNTCWSMVKNNQYRDHVAEGLTELFVDANKVTLNWTNSNRIPSPGSWFTTRSQSWGGVSRDLMPHLLSWFTMFSKGQYATAEQISCQAEQCWQLDQIDSTEYGTVNKNGTHDVDDHARLVYSFQGKTVELEANWRNLQYNERGIEFEFADNSTNYFKFELCPEQAYANMVSYLWQKCQQKDQEFWQQELAEDLWIHQQLTLLSTTDCCIHRVKATLNS